MEGAPRAQGQGPFPYDAPVYVSGLEKTIFLNDRGARVCSHAPRDDGRVSIQMLCSPETRVWIKTQNLTRLMFAEELEGARFCLMSDVERTDMRMYVSATQGAAPVPGSSAVLMCTRINDQPLSAHEKAELLRVGQWGSFTSRMEWGDLVRQMKRHRNGVYPRDWHAQVVVGNLFADAGHPVTSGMSIGGVSVRI